MSRQGRICHPFELKGARCPDTMSGLFGGHVGCFTVVGPVAISVRGIAGLGRAKSQKYSLHGGVEFDVP